MYSQGSFLDRAYHKGLSKLLSSDVVKKTHPMIERVDTYVFDDDPMMYFKVILNDGSITKKNMGLKGYIPRHLVEKYFYQLMKYFEIPEDFKYQIITVGPNGEIIHDYTHY